MILVKLRNISEAKRKHWNWFRGILGDVKDWYVSDQKNAIQTRKMTREECIKKILKLKKRKQIKKIVFADYHGMRKLIKNHPEWIYNGRVGAISVNERDALLRAFGYKNDFYKKRKWSAFVFFHWTNVKVCPYCNVNPVGVGVDKKRKIKTRNQIDHFFPEAIYPFLSISLFNLIPSCTDCNKNKLSFDTYINEMVYPYARMFGRNGKFFISFPFHTLAQEGLFKKSIVDDIEFDVKKYDETDVVRRDINNSILQLKITPTYNAHAQFAAKNLLNVCQSRCHSRIGMLQSMGFPKNAILQHLDSYASSNCVDYPYKKMKEDVLDQLEKYMKNTKIYYIK